MIARRYVPDDFAQIQEWGMAYGSKYNEDQFPSVGFIVDGLAAYFLYQTDSLCCWLENLVCRKDAPYIEREEAIGLVIGAVIDEAKSLGFRVAYASTNRYSVAVRARKLGAAIEPNHLMLTLKL